MRLVKVLVFFVLTVLFTIYLSLPENDYPQPPPGSLISNEPADTETPLRRAFYTNLTRQEVISHYRNNFDLEFFGFDFKAIALNYPPEEAQTLIRDQTRSTFLEELVFPMRESLYINGFEPKLDKDKIVIAGKSYRQKIIVKYQGSRLAVRVFVGFLTTAYIFWFTNLLNIIRKERNAA